MNITKFARLIAYITNVSRLIPDEHHINDIQNMVSQLNESQTVNVHEVDALLKAMFCNQKIEAIKAYRTLTGMGLKESKDAVEKHWYGVNQPHNIYGR